jgi:hypothetical protein
LSHYPWGSALATLTRLQVLHLEKVKLAPADALLLRALTGLSELRLNGAQAGLNDTVVSALALKLTQLVELRLQDCGISSQASLPALASLTCLRDLDFKRNYCTMDDLGLLLLTDLTGLTRLCTPRPHRISSAVRQQFLGAMPSVDRVLLSTSTEMLKMTSLMMIP